MMLLNDFHKNTIYVSALLKSMHPQFFNSYQKIIIEAGLNFKLLHGAKDIWAADFMPLQKSDGSFVGYIYDPDYLKPKRYTHLRSDQDMVWYENSLPWEKKSCALILDGGNIVHYKNKIICTEKVFTENPQLTIAQVRHKLEEHFESEVIVIPVYPGDWLGHADGIVRFIDEHAVIVNEPMKYNAIDMDYHVVLTRKLKLAGLGCCKLPSVCMAKSSARGLYINYTEIRTIIMPVFNLPEDELAYVKLSKYFPKKNILTLKSNAIAKKNGVLNCVSWIISTTDSSKFS